jgi:hypothetical protein
MNSEKVQLIQQHAEDIAALLYEDTSPEQVKTLESIEKTFREKVLNMLAQPSRFFICTSIGENQGRWRCLKPTFRCLESSRNN